MERIQLDDFTKFHFLSGLEFSGDGKYACFAVHKANLDQTAMIQTYGCIELKQVLSAYGSK